MTQKPYEFIWFGTIHGTKTYEFIKFGTIRGVVHLTQPVGRKRHLMLRNSASGPEIGSYLQLAAGAQQLAVGWTGPHPLLR